MTDSETTASQATISRSGNPVGPALLLIHGWAQDQRIFDKLRAEMAADFDLYSYDRRGYGASTLVADLSQEHLDVVALVQKLEAKRLTVLGFSQGARIAARFASYAPQLVHKLIICGGGMDGYVADSVDNHAIDLPHFKTLALAGELAELRRQWLLHPYCRLGMDEQAMVYLSNITEDYCGNDLTAPAGHDFSLPGNVYNQLVKQNIPTLFINGEHEAPPRLELAQRYVASSQSHHRIMIKGAGHMAVLSHAAQVADAIRAFDI